MDETLRVYKVGISKVGIERGHCPLGADDTVRPLFERKFGPAMDFPPDPITGANRFCQEEPGADHCWIIVAVNDDYPVDTAPEGRVLSVELLDSESGNAMLDEHRKWAQKHGLIRMNPLEQLMAMLAEIDEEGELVHAEIDEDNLPDEF